MRVLTKTNPLPQAGGAAKLGPAKPGLVAAGWASRPRRILPTPLRLASKLASLATPPACGRGLIALAALALAAPAQADTLVDNVNGITLDKDGKVVRFTGMVIGTDGKVKQLLDRKDKRPERPDFKEDGKGRTLIPGMIAGLAFLLGLAFWFGIKERRRLGHVHLPQREAVDIADLGVSQYPEARRPHLRKVNAALVIALLGLLVWGILPLSVLMMIAFAIAMIVNYPGVAQQKERIAAHAGNVLSVVSLIFAAGIFTGILGGTGMVEAMSKEVVGFIPPALGPYMAPITALLSMPFTFFISNDAFYFGMLPILAEAGAHYGVDPMAIARASLMGQPVHLLSPLVPSTYLLVSLAGIDLADHQRFTLLPAAAVCIVMTLVGMIALAFPFVA